MDEHVPLETIWWVTLIAGALAAGMLALLWRSLPLQNLAAIAAVILGGEAGVEFFLLKYVKVYAGGTSLWQYLAGVAEVPGWRILGSAAVLWLGVILLGRRLARTILHPWRKLRWTWFWVLLLASLWTAGIQFGWTSGWAGYVSDGISDLAEKFGINARAPAVPPHFMSKEMAAQLAGFRGLSAFVLLGVLTPFFIRKRPRPGEKSEFAQQPQEKA